MKISSLANMTEFVTWCDYLGTFAFAISGIRLSASKRFDWFGAYVVGMVTAVGGGTIRDMLINLRPFWLEAPSYLIITGIALIFTIVFRKQIVKANPTLFFFDSVGLGLFVVVGIAKTFDAGYPWWAAVVLGTVTGSFGGMIRDVLISEIPLIFRTDFYALACLSGGLVYVALARFTDLPLSYIQVATALSVVGLRLLAITHKWSVPSFKGDEES